MAYSDSFSKASDEFQSWSLGSEDANTLYCQPCQLDEKHVPAHGYCQTCEEHLCDECYRTHRRPAPLRNHVLLDSSNMPRTQGPGLSSLENCVKHHGEAVKFFCKTHNIPGCSSCDTIDHRNCEIVYITEAVREFGTSGEYNNLLQSLEDIKQTCYTVEENFAKIQNSREAVGHKIRDFRKQINEQLDIAEMALHAENDAKHDTEQQRVTLEIHYNRALLQQIEQLQENLARLKTTGNNTQLYIEAKKCATSINHLQETAKLIEKNTKFHLHVRFKQNDNTINTLRPGNCVGAIFCDRGDTLSRIFEELLL